MAEYRLVLRDSGDILFILLTIPCYLLKEFSSTKWACYWFASVFQYLSTADFAMREELSLKAAILAEKFAPDLSWWECYTLEI